MIVVRAIPLSYILTEHFTFKIQLAGVGKRLTRVREQLGLKQKQMAKDLEKYKEKK